MLIFYVTERITLCFQAKESLSKVDDQLSCVDELLEDMSPPPEDPQLDQALPGSANGMHPSSDQEAPGLVQEGIQLPATLGYIITGAADDPMDTTETVDWDVTETKAAGHPIKESKQVESESVSVAPLSRPLLLALRASSLNLPPNTLEKAVVAANRSAMQMAADHLLRLLPDALASKVGNVISHLVGLILQLVCPQSHSYFHPSDVLPQARSLGPGNTALTLYARPCDSPSWEITEKQHASQRQAMMRYMAQRAGLVELQQDAQVEQYGRFADHLKKHLLTSKFFINYIMDVRWIPDASFQNLYIRIHLLNTTLQFLARRREGGTAQIPDKASTPRPVPPGSGRYNSRSAVKSDYEEQRIIGNFQVRG